MYFLEHDKDDDRKQKAKSLGSFHHKIIMFENCQEEE
jgi:hypothetical protein